MLTNLKSNTSFDLAIRIHIIHKPVDWKTKFNKNKIHGKSWVCRKWNCKISWGCWLFRHNLNMTNNVGNIIIPNTKLSIYREQIVFPWKNVMFQPTWNNKNISMFSHVFACLNGSRQHFFSKRTKMQHNAKKNPLRAICFNPNLFVQWKIKGRKFVFPNYRSDYGHSVASKQF